MAALSVASLNADARKALISKLTTALKALEVYDSDSANPGLVTVTNAALAAAQAQTLTSTQVVLNSGVEFASPAATGSYVNGYTPTIVAGAVTALAGS